MSLIEVANIIALVVVPILAVIIGEHLQDRKEKRKDKMQILQHL